MKLRARIADELEARLKEHLPEALETIWGEGDIVVAVESLRLEASAGYQDDWLLIAGFEGHIAAEIRADDIDDLPIEALLGSLIEGPTFIDFEGDIGVLSERARATLLEMRDAVRDTQIVTLLRFSVSGLLARRVPEADRPDLMLGIAPDIGRAHEPDYRPIADMATGIEGALDD